jgi:hypothetical protein
VTTEESDTPQPIEVKKAPIDKVTDESGLGQLLDEGVFAADDVTPEESST